jgi:hypothetical protein
MFGCNINMNCLLLLAFVLQVSTSVIQLPKNQTACTGADWSAVLIFLVSNHVAHTATVVRFAGETTKELNWRWPYALPAPFVDLMFALRKVQLSLVFERNALRRACRGDGLCQFVRTPSWQSWDGCVIKAKIFKLLVSASAETSNLSAALPCTRDSSPSTSSGGYRSLESYFASLSVQRSRQARTLYLLLVRNRS